MRHLWIHCFIFTLTIIKSIQGFLYMFMVTPLQHTNMMTHKHSDLHNKMSSRYADMAVDEEGFPLTCPSLCGTPQTPLRHTESWRLALAHHWWASITHSTPTKIAHAYRTRHITYDVGELHTRTHTSSYCPAGARWDEIAGASEALVSGGPSPRGLDIGRAAVILDFKYNCVARHSMQSLWSH